MFRCDVQFIDLIQYVMDHMMTFEGYTTCKSSRLKCKNFRATFSRPSSSRTPASLLSVITPMFQKLFLQNENFLTFITEQNKRKRRGHDLGPVNLDNKTFISSSKKDAKLLVVPADHCI